MMNQKERFIMKTKLILSNDQYSVVIPKNIIQKLELNENDELDIDVNLKLTQIIVGKPDEKNIEDIEASQDF